MIDIIREYSKNYDFALWSHTMEHKQLAQLIEVVKAHLKSEWINPTQLQEETGLSLKTQANLRSQGKLPYYRIGNVVRYKRQEIDSLFESAKVA